MRDEGAVGSARRVSQGATHVLRSYPWLFAWMAQLPVLVVRASNLVESDIFWQTRTGQKILADRSLPTTDPFSWTVMGKEWSLNSWGFDVLQALFYGLGGLGGLAFLGFALGALLAAMLLLLARSMGGRPLGSAAAVQLGLLLSTPFISARPQIVDYLVVTVLALVVRPLERRDRRALPTMAAVAVLVVAWANLHLSATLAVAMFGVATAVAVVLRRPTPVVLGLLGVTVVSAASVFATPFGTGILAQTLHVQDASTPLIVEWQPFDPTSPYQWAILAIGASGLAIAVSRREILLTGILSVSLVAALYAYRFLPFVVLLGATMLSVASVTGPVGSYMRSRRPIWITGAAMYLVSLTAMAVVLSPNIGRPTKEYPSSALVAEIPSGCRVFTSIQLGGWLILTRPDVLVSFDTRNDLYGAELVDRLYTAGRSATGDVDADVMGAGCVFVPPDYGLAERLQDNQEWRRLGSEPAAALYVRT